MQQINQEKSFSYNPFVLQSTAYELPSSEKEIKYDLGIIENLYPHSPDVLNVLNSSIHINVIQKYHRYNKTHKNLEHKLCNLHSATSQNIMLSNGSDGIIEQLLKTFCTEKSLISIITPTYPHFEQKAAQTCRVENINYNHYTEDFSNILPNGEVVYITNPNMPFGYERSDDIRQLIKLYPNKLFIIDEAYIDLSNAKTLSDLIYNHKNIIVIRTLSKSFGLPGIRLGYCLFHESHYDQLIKTFSIKNISPFAANIAIAALNSIEHYQNNHINIKSEYQRIRRALRDICQFNKMIFYYEMNDAPFYILFAHDTKYVKNEFEKVGILVRDKSKDIPFALRVTVATPDVNNIVIEKIKQINSIDIHDLGFQNYADLDGTLRSGTKGLIYSHAHEFIDKYKCIILTNNVETDKSQLTADISHNTSIITPIDNLKKIQCDVNIKNAYFVGQKNKLPVESYDSIVICNDIFNIDMNCLAEIAYLLNKFRKVFVFEFFEEGPLDKCTNNSNPLYAKIKVPYIGKFLNMFAIDDIEIIDFGKAGMKFKNVGLVIGDTLETDGNFCFKNNGVFVHILNDESQLRWNGRYFTIGSIKQMI